ncbi:MAG: hypothetical protein NPIRA02_12870 [Nitrospirales bacterium]|nr:MAG: hypothetical protein NPIRA02_12870 [Nitrospirales bacterium]
MKQKLGTLIEEHVMRLAKRRAAEEGRPLYELIEDALTQYLNGGAASANEREMAYQVFCERPLKLSRAQFRHILEENCWDS